MVVYRKSGPTNVAGGCRGTHTSKVRVTNGASAVSLAAGMYQHPATQQLVRQAVAGSWVAGGNELAACLPLSGA